MEGHRCAHLCLILPQPLEFPLRPLIAHHRVMMIPVQRPSGNKYIEFGAAREGLVLLLQDH